jgi:two-component sensor histidine kinase
MEALLQYIFGSCCENTEKIRLIKELWEAQISLDSAVPLGLMINELVSNALFHGFSNGDSGYVRLSFSETARSVVAAPKEKKPAGSGDACKTRKRYSLVVENRGGKPPEKSLEKIEKKLGLTLTEALVQQLEGSISYEGYEDGLKTTVFCTLF